MRDNGNPPPPPPPFASPSFPPSAPAAGCVGGCGGRRRRRARRRPTAVPSCQINKFIYFYIAQQTQSVSADIHNIYGACVNRPIDPQSEPLQTQPPTSPAAARPPHPPPPSGSPLAPPPPPPSPAAASSLHLLLLPRLPPYPPRWVWVWAVAAPRAPARAIGGRSVGALGCLLVVV